jgi:hypothetical protein
MSILTTALRSAWAAISPDYEAQVSKDMLFDMPLMGEDTAIIMGATSGTSLMAAKAVAAGHTKFLIVGGQAVGQEDPRLTALLEKSHRAMGLPLPVSINMTEKDYGRYVLEEHFNVPSANVITFSSDRSTNTQQNFEVLKEHRVHTLPAVELYGLAGAARRILMTARKVWSGEDVALSVHNCFPHGFDKENWKHDLAASMYLMSEVDKIPGYVARGFCVPVDIDQERARVRTHVAKKQKGPEQIPGL